MSGASIVLEQVGRDYATPSGHAVRALEGIDLDVPAGTSVAVTGPSGCGKSTLLGLLAGLEPPTTGRVRVDGQDLAPLGDAGRARLRRERLGLVFQADNLLPFLTAAENLALQLALGAGRAHDRVPALLAELGLADHADKLPDQLSGGERQRVAVAGALINDPSVILADEPTGSLDGHSSDGVIELLLDAQREGGATLLVVTHDPRVAERMDSAIRLHDGRRVEDRDGERLRV